MTKKLVLHNWTDIRAQELEKRLSEISLKVENDTNTMKQSIEALSKEADITIPYSFKPEDYRV